jgi:hypothetical protein
MIAIVAVSKGSAHSRPAHCAQENRSAARQELRSVWHRHGIHHAVHTRHRPGPCGCPGITTSWRKRALLTIQDAANADADFFVHAEARFALWEIKVREHNVAAAVAVAGGLAADFPENPELAKYLSANDSARAMPHVSEPELVGRNTRAGVAE